MSDHSDYLLEPLTSVPDRETPLRSAPAGEGSSDPSPSSFPAAREDRRAEFASRRAEIDREEGLDRELRDVHEIPPHLASSSHDSHLESKPVLKEPTSSLDQGASIAALLSSLQRMETRFSDGFNRMETRLRDVEGRSRSPSRDPVSGVSRPRFAYGRTPPPQRVPFDLDHSRRRIPRVAEVDPRVKMMAPTSWKGVFNDHAALEIFIEASRGYYMAVGKLSLDDSLVLEATQFFVSTLFSSEKISGLSALEWLRGRFATVTDSRKYTLEDLYDDMRQFWSDPLFGERMLAELHALRQGSFPANVYGALHLSLTSKCDATELTPALVVRIFLQGLQSAALDYVKLRIHEETARYKKLGHVFVPSHDELVEWASARDAKLGPTRVPSAGVSAIQSRAVSKPSIAIASPSPSLSVPGRKITRASWESGAARFQERFALSDRSSWPAGRIDPPADGVNCWNCGGRGHWSLNCTNERVVPAIAVLASIRAGWVEATVDWEDDEVDEFESYGRAAEGREEEDGADLMGFA